MAAPDTQDQHGSGRRRWLDLFVIGVALVLVALAVVATTRPEGGDRRAPTTTTGTAAPTTENDRARSIPLGVELTTDGTLRFHVPACATEGATRVFRNIAVREPFADLEGWSIIADTPRRLRTVVPGSEPDGFRTTDPLDASRSQMRDDAMGLAAVDRLGPLLNVGVVFRLVDLRPGQVLYRPHQPAYLHFAASVAEFDAAVTCDE